MRHSPIAALTAAFLLGGCKLIHTNVQLPGQSNYVPTKVASIRLAK